LNLNNFMLTLIEKASNLERFSNSLYQCN
jgi:hypothetical protein